MVIRKLTSEDYEQAEALFHKLHNIHVAALPDMFKERDRIYRKREISKSSLKAKIKFFSALKKRAE